jgi:anti-sigma factor RsiW
MNSLSAADRSELLAGYVLGNLSAEEVAMVETYMAEHPETQHELQALQAAWNLMPLALPATQPNPGLRERILQGAALPEPLAAPATTAQANVQTGRRRSKSWWLLLGTALLGAIGCGGLGWQNYRLQSQFAAVQQQFSQELQQMRQQAQESQTIFSRSDTRLLPVKAMEKAYGSGSLVLAPVKTKALLTLQKVPTLPKGQVYKIWALKPNGERDCGHFVPNAQGGVSMELPLGDWDGATGIAITVEKVESTEAEGPEVMGGEI